MNNHGSTPHQVMTSQQRRLIPDAYQLLFADWSDDALLSLSRDELQSLKVRAYAGWELDFRNAFGIEVPFPTMAWPFKWPAAAAR